MLFQVYQMDERERVTTHAAQKLFVKLESADLWLAIFDSIENLTNEAVGQC